MFSRLRLTPLVLAISALVDGSRSSGLELLKQRDACLADNLSPIVVHISTNVVQYPVYINTYIAANTIININGGVTININNAPTNLSTVVTATKTVTEISTVTATDTTTTTAGSAATSAPFVLAVSVPAGTRKRAALNEGYVGFSGNEAIVVADKSAAALFTAADGQLFSDGNFIGLLNSQLATGYGPFESFATEPEISRTFSVSISTGTFTFSNGNFVLSSGFATFCETPERFIINKYTADPPFTCITINLVAQLPSSPTSTSASASASATADPSGDLNVEPTGLPKARKLVKKTLPQGHMRRGGIFRSPLKSKK